MGTLMDEWMVWKQMVAVYYFYIAWVYKLSQKLTNTINATNIVTEILVKMTIMPFETQDVATTVMKIKSALSKFV